MAGRPGHSVITSREFRHSKQVDAVIYVPGDLEGSKPVVDLLTGAGIPVIGVNTEVAEMDKLISWIGSPIVQSGELLMQGIADVLGGKGNIVELPVRMAICLKLEDIKES